MRIGEPARKHRIADDDIWHAIRNPITAFEAGDLTMIIGAASDGALLEVGILGEDSDDPRDHPCHAATAQLLQIPLRGGDTDAME